MTRKIISIVSLILVALLVVSCGSAQNSQPQAENSEDCHPIFLKLWASPVPHAEILNVVKPLLEAEGIELQIVEFADYNQPNLRLADKDLDANYFQHIPYLESFSKDHNLDLTYTAKVHIEPMGIYSEKIKDISELEDGAEIAIPNDPTNGGRALILLEQAGLLKIKEGVGITATVYDIVENPKNLKITELEAATLPRVLGDVAAAVINSNYALEAKFVPTKDALVLESPQDNPYVNILAIRQGDENRPEIVKLSEALNSPEVKKFIEDEYQGAVIPAF